MFCRYYIGKQKKKSVSTSNTYEQQNIKESSILTKVCIVSPCIIRNCVRNLNVSTIFPLNKVIRIMNECSAKIINWRVLFESSLSMTIGKRFLNLESLNVQWIVCRVVRRSKSIAERKEANKEKEAWNII